MIWLMLSFGCALSSPFVGPGFSDGEYTSDHEGPFVVAVTYARQARGEGEAFADHVDAIEEQMQRSEGIVGYSLRGDLVGRDNWTMSIWESEPALLAFVTREAHGDAMIEADTVLEDSEFTHWVETDPEAMPPTWEQGLDYLEGQ
jgi:quinol monooxygenase YgiN